MNDLAPSEEAKEGKAKRTNREGRLREFLGNRTSFPHQPESVKLLQTHASYVAIAPPFVYKVKKEVDLGFLDFSTLSKRKYFCDEEVRLNSRLCSTIYEGVVPIFERERTLSFDAPNGEAPVEFAVKMRALRADQFLDQILDNSPHEVDANTIDAIVARLVPFYRSQTPEPEVLKWGSVDNLRISTDENFEQTKPFCGADLPPATFDVVRWYTDNFFEQHGDLFNRRVEEGRILDCHGDLHAEHIHLSDSGVCIYDCIEFNKRFRSIDVASDVAFLSMDLRRHDRPHLALAFADKIATQLDDHELLTLLPFYACYRAYVRGKVDLLRSDAREVPGADRLKSRKRGKKYFQLALDYALTGGKAVVVICMGRVGTGKSTTASRLETVLGWSSFSSDRIRKLEGGVPLYERASQTQPHLYDPVVTETVYAELADRALRNADAGFSSVLDATYSTRKHRHTLRQKLEAASVPYAFIEMVSGEESVKERLHARETAGEIVSDARLEDMEMLNTRFEDFEESEVQPIRIKTEGAVEGSVTELLMRLYEALNTTGQVVERDEP